MFATIIKEYRKSVNMTQEEMAYKLGISTNHLSRVERRKVKPSGDLINRIIGIISNDQKILNIELNNTELYGLVLFLNIQKLTNDNRTHVFQDMITTLKMYI